MKKFATLLALIAMVGVANATDFSSLGFTTVPGEVVLSGLDECSGTLMVNHDFSFENGYAWRYAGIQAPYYGAFGEGFSMGGGTNVQCIALFLSDLGYYTGQLCDVYIWEGGVSGLPGNVLTVMTGYTPGAPATWPAVSEHDADIPDYVVAGTEFTVGYWGNWPGLLQGWFVGADLDGFGGYPWTCLAPGSGYGTGWTDPSVVWGTTMSMGLGFYYGESTPAESATWGSIKALFE
jgi:hypothetical protein